MSKKIFNSKVQVKDTDGSSSVDNIVSIDANGELKRTTQTVSDIGGGGAPTLQAVLDTGNTSTTGISLSNSNLTSSSGLNAATVSPTDVSVEGRFGGTHLLESSVARWGANPATQRNGISFQNPSSISVLTVRNITGEAALVSELPDMSNYLPYFGATQSVDMGNNGISFSSGNSLSEIYPTSTTIQQFQPSLSYNDVLALSAQAVNMSKDNGVGVSIAADMQATGVTLLEAGSPTVELNKDELRQYKGAFYGATKVNSTLTANRTYTMPDKDINVAGLDDIMKVINTSTPQTSATLNANFPFASNPVKTQVLNTDGVQRYIYTRVSSTSWRRSELMTDI